MSTARPIGSSSENTRSAILDMIRSSGTVTRVDLAQMSGLTATSITRVVKSLLDDGLVVETGFEASTGGKRRSVLELNPTARYAVGVSLDDARLVIVVVDLAGNVVGRLDSRGIGQSTPADEVKRIAALLDELFRQLQLPVADVVGVGVAGAGLDLRAGDQLSVTATEWDDFDVQSALSPMVGLPVVWGNDAACAALGQFWLRRIPSTQAFGVLYMANGFGLGLMSHGSVERGASSNVGEIGHLVLDVDGPACWCGSGGCLEMLAAPRSMIDQAMAEPGLAELIGLRGGARDLRHDHNALARAAAAGEPRCAQIVERSARYVAAAVLSVVNLLDLDLLYLAGPGFGDVGANYVRAIRSSVDSMARTRRVHPVTVELAEPGFDAVATGAATLALQHVLTPHTGALSTATR